MSKTIAIQVTAYLVVAFSLIFSQFSLADESIHQIDLCPEEINSRAYSDFDPLKEFGKTIISSGVGAQSGRALAQVTDTVTVTHFIREAGAISGRTIVWIFEVGNPFAIAIGYIFIPTTSAKCDVIYSRDPDCQKRLPCVAKIQ
jgi:hypothetical protein